MPIDYPDTHTSSFFTHREELGLSSRDIVIALIGSSAILGLFLLFIFIGIGIFSDGTDPFAAIVNAGLTISAGLGNNFFSIEINTGEMLTIIIPDGIYNDTTLIAAINLAITNIPLLNNPATYQIIMSQNLNRCTIFTNSSVSNYEFTLFFQGSIQGTDNFAVPLPFKLGWIMGFRLGLYTSEFVYTSEGSIDLYGPKYIYLVFDDYNNNVNNGFFSAFNSSVLNNNILARISMNSNTFGSVIQNNLAIITQSRQYFGPVNINKVNIQLLDEYGRILDMHSMDYSFCVTFNVVYDL